MIAPVLVKLRIAISYILARLERTFFINTFQFSFVLCSKGRIVIKYNTPVPTQITAEIM